MRIIPHELYQYAPDLSLTALRKEFGMHDYCLNVNPHNKAMQPFLDLKRNYFNLLIHNWVIEMHNRGHYVNTFHSFYAQNNSFEVVQTDFFLILECCVQWDLKEFLPYNTDLTWYDISLKFLKESESNIQNFTKEKYQHLLEWYKDKFMDFNQSGKLKPKQLNMSEVIKYFNEYLINK
ncbi:hypothetical protein [Spiroplasma eriocheiris]|uniref:Uncharacterized protein n=1 Tax=Spiroplasma eriocheiris TaxID=315358 RepID=A0A0H3XI37_9MOLU|nr:hypothetical protein [Spiroplasma eriocheiris]AHF58057.1 hypothetical protein SPE_0937 [Spiroplasma eriocheiris CCTCC M 207170]AKM54498.1 hypothetical protein SERIO_v1c09380 [Spiroplasma eriocheiris]